VILVKNALLGLFVWWFGGSPRTRHANRGRHACVFFARVRLDQQLSIQLLLQTQSSLLVMTTAASRTKM
jgi:hypothetical protein